MNNNGTIHLSTDLPYDTFLRRFDQICNRVNDHLNIERYKLPAHESECKLRLEYAVTWGIIRRAYMSGKLQHCLTKKYGQNIEVMFHRMITAQHKPKTSGR
jgi:hypothetical protein